ncbi:MAG: type III-A CRISPR-associated protein Cas10/Csm1 [Candidatus Sumerlaeaceae bacterium]|nr:type III-A CRISPR-associated protein Cas10/Csm1 [Candidatus Sumerlaeaceae bacterium]
MTQPLSREELLLAVLLHDAGKVSQRASVTIPFRDDGPEAQTILPSDANKTYFSHQHALHTLAFFTALAQAPPHGTDSSLWSRLDPVASKHHNPSDENPLEWIVAEADRLSSGMDRRPCDEADALNRARGDFRRVRLRSILSSLAMGPHKSPPPPAYHRLAPLDPTDDSAFPIHSEPKDDTMAAEYKTCWEAFTADFRATPFADWTQYLNAVDAVLQRHWWCVPSSTVDQPDIPLYDHSRTAAAIAGALWDYHTAAGDWSVSAICDRSRPKFRLVAGDLSGIQRSIFRFNRSNSRGVAKVLRARSFELSLITRAAAVLIASRLGLSPLQVIMDAGGRFVMLTGNTPEVDQILTAVDREIAAWMRTRYAGELSLNLDWSVTLAGQDFQPGSFGAKLDLLADTLDERKARPSAALLQQNNQWQHDALIIDNDYAQYGAEVCPVAGYGAPTATITMGNRTIRVSPTTREQFELGGRLVSAGRVEIAVGNLSNADLTLFGGGISIRLRDRDDNAPPAQGNLSLALNRFLPGHGIWYLANYVPRVTREDLKKPTEDDLYPGQPRPFDVMARQALRCEGDSTRGTAMLGLLKADVDNLGALASLGLGPARPLSRFVAFSRMLHFFFAGVLPARLETQKRLNNTYTLYAGGDDLFFVADWETAFEVAGVLREEFRRYTGANPAVTISAGIAMLKPAQPIAEGARLAEEQLETAKNRPGKDSLCVFNTTVPWCAWPPIWEYRDFLKRHLATDGQKIGLRRGFLHRLLRYARSHADSDRKPRNLLWRSRLAYDIGRNIANSDNIAKLRRKEDLTPEQRRLLDLHGGLLRLFSTEGKDKVLMDYLRVPVSWVLYHIRGGQ